MDQVYIRSYVTAGSLRGKAILNLQSDFLRTSCRRSFADESRACGRNCLRIFFRYERKLLGEVVVDNLLSWRRSGFSAHGAVCVQDREGAVRLGRYMIRCPIDLRDLRALKGSPLALDIYSWLTYRMRYLRKPYLIPWAALQTQFGADYSR